MNTGQCEWTLSGHSNTVRGVCFIPNGSKVVTCSGDTQLTSCVSNLIIRECVSQIDKIFFSLPIFFRWLICFVWWPISSQTQGQVRHMEPRRHKIASRSDDKMVKLSTIKLWDTQGGKVNSTLNGHSSYVTSVVWNNDGTKLTSGSFDNTVRIWTVGSVGTFEWQSTFTQLGNNSPPHFVV